MTPKHHHPIQDRNPWMLKHLCATGAAALALGVFAPTALAETIQYRDGASTRSATLQADMMAEFAPLPAAGARNASGNTPFVTLHKILPNQRTAPLGAHQSPVFREGSSPAGRLMALPGGVIVNFSADWSDADVSAWISGHGYHTRQRLPITGQWYVIDTPAGRAALQTAQAIQSTGEVVSATPNWWMQTVAR